MAKNEIPRQSAHAEKHKSFNQNLANEFTRNWDEKAYENKNKNPNNHYDYSRHEQNFEIDSEGNIVPLDSQKISLRERLKKRLDELNFKFYYDKNGNISQNSPNCCVSYVVSGDTNVLNKLAWGDQKVNFSKEEMGKANWNVRRQKEIENWAMDEYSFFCKTYGKENIICFAVHLDETTPHIHVLVVPVALRKKFGRTREYENINDSSLKIGMKEHDKLDKEEKKNWRPVDEKDYIETVSFNKVFGANTKQRKEYMKEFHTRHYEAVGKKYGLERGRDLDSLPEEERAKVKHRTKAEYHRFKETEEEYQVLSDSVDLLKKKKSSLVQDLINLGGQKEANQKEIKKQEKAIKGLSTMILNLQNNRDQINHEIEDLESGKESAGDELDKKRSDLAAVEAKLTDKMGKLREAERKSEEAKLKLAELLKKEGEMKAQIIEEAQAEADNIREQGRADAEKMKKAPTAAIGQKFGELLGKDKTKKELQKLQKEYSDYKAGETERISNAEKKGHDDAMKKIMDITGITYTKKSGKNRDDILSPEDVSKFILSQKTQINNLKIERDDAKKVQIVYGGEDYEDDLRKSGRRSVLEEISSEAGFINLSKDDIVDKLKESTELKSENSKLLSEIADIDVDNNVRNMALELFLGGSAGCGGGGGSNYSDLRWDGRNKDENDRDYYNRCLQFARTANSKSKKKNKGLSM